MVEPYLKLGTNGEGVLLIHGYTASPGEMLPLADYLYQKGYTVLGVRLAGHGTTVEDLATKTASDWVNSALDAYYLLRGITTQIHLIGQSMGGLIALELAKTVRADKLVLLAVPFQISAERGLRDLPPKDECRGVYIPKARRRGVGVPEVANFSYRQMPLITVYELLDLIQAATSEIEKIDNPTLIIHSTNDHTADPKSAKLYAEKISGSKLIMLEKSGHILTIGEEKETVFQSVADFLGTK